MKKKLNNELKKGAMVLTAVGMLLTGGMTAQAKSKSTQKPVKGSKVQLVDVILKPKNEAGLSKYVYQTVTPGNSKYHKYLSSHQVAQKYGQSDSKVKVMRKYLAKYHIKGVMYAGNMVLAVKGKTSDIQKAFYVKLYTTKQNGVTIQKTKGTPKISGSLGKNVLAIAGLSNYQSYTNNNQAQNAGKMQSNVMYKRVANTSTNDSPQKFMNQYNVDSLYSSGNDGSGKSIGIISFANFNTKDATQYWKSEGIPAKNNRISVYHTNDYKGSWDGYDETTIDVEQAGAIAPRANIKTYIGKSDVTGMINSLAAAVGQNKVDSLSLSWGQSEKQIQSEIKLGTTPKQYNQIMNFLFMQAAAQGISVFTASGDSGAYDGIQEGQNPGLKVDAPANSPYVTAVGGTTLPASYTVNGKKLKITKERAWSSDFLYPNYAKQQFYSRTAWLASYFAGTGGGFSTLNGLPAYQKKIAGVGSYNATQLWQIKGSSISILKKAKNVSGSHSGRNVPDVSVNADPNTGYSTYLSNAKTGKHGQWFVSGGTSIAAPQVAAASTLISNSNGKRLGFWNPQIYKFAKTKQSPFTKLDSRNNNSNLYYTGQPGKIYNQATGLGTINFGKLNSAFKSQK